MQTASPNPASTTASRPALAALAFAMLLASLGISIATVALPTLARAFDAPMPHVQWVALAYLLAVTAAVVVAGRLGDLLGMRPVFLAGIGLFAAGSALSAAAPTLAALVAARAVQGLGGAVLMALPVALAGRVSGGRTGAAMGLLGTMSAIGTALGPSLGGLVIAAWDWRAAFLLLALMALACLAFAARSLPAEAIARPKGRACLDLPGAAVLAAALVCFSLAATGGREGFAPLHAALLAAAAIGAAVFVRIERRSPSPLVRLAVLRDRPVAAALAMNLAVASVMMSTLIVGPFFLAFALGLGEAQTGLVMAVGPAVAALSGVPAGFLVDRFGAGRVMLLGLGQMTAGLVALALLPHLAGVAGYVAALVLLTPAFQMFLAANNAAVMTGAGEGQRGMISGLLGLTRNLGLMTGASVAGAIFALAAGTRDIAAAEPGAVGTAFSTVFLLAAGLTAASLAAALLLRTGSQPEPQAR